VTGPLDDPEPRLDKFRDLAPEPMRSDDDEEAFEERLRPIVPKPTSVQRQVEESHKAIRRSEELLAKTKKAGARKTASDQEG
jgi:hypothetical protein